MSEDEIRALEATGGKVSFSSLTNTKKLVPLIESALKGTDPFYFDNETWDRFLKRVAPQLFLALLLDMKIVPMSKRGEFVRHMNKTMLKVSAK